VKDLAASRRFYAAVLAPLSLVADSSGSGFGPEGAPGLRVDYSPSYYAAFLIDPDGNNVEAVCMAPR
jgi:hypothetical protein